MNNPKCPYCGQTMAAAEPFFDKFSGSYSTFAKCWRCGSQGPMIKSSTATGAQGRAMKHALHRPAQKPLRWQQLEELPIVWLEDNGERAVIPAFPCPGSKSGVMSFLTNEHEFVTSIKTDYGKHWRAWAAQPTQEERSAAKWM